MPTTNAMLDVVLVAIDASFVGFFSLVGLVLVFGGLDLALDAFRRWRGRP